MTVITNTKVKKNYTKDDFYNATKILNRVKEYGIGRAAVEKKIHETQLRHVKLNKPGIKREAISTAGAHNIGGYLVHPEYVDILCQQLIDEAKNKGK